MKCNRGIKILALAAAGFAFSVSAGAQSTHSTTDPTVGQRKENHQDRIAQGVRSGQLTPRETRNLEAKQAALNHETRSMRKMNDGKLTAGDKRVVNAQQNRLSRNIYRDKHNGRRQ